MEAAEKVVLCTSNILSIIFEKNTGYSGKVLRSITFSEAAFHAWGSNRNAYGFTVKVLSPTCANREVFRAPLHEIPRLTHAKMGCICLFCVHLYRTFMYGGTADYMGV
jgi:hypothetical protein